MTNVKRTRIKLGDVYLIPLSDGRFAFGRRFKDSCIAIYRYIADSTEDIPQEEDYQFIVGVYDILL
ncbi:hypothetical protein [Paenibacillus sp. MMO-58]|uniref:hypothetical protein n=1 Tax=Paenibacillus sp. MMO-58 TaxID=3081290 RepID=UPI003017B284